MFIFEAPPIKLWIIGLHIFKFLKEQFYKVIITPYRSISIYKNKTTYGVLTIYFNNRKLRDTIVGEIGKL